MNNDLEQFSEERLKEISELTGAYEEWSPSQDEIHALARIALSAKQAKPVTMDSLRDAVAEMSGGLPMEWKEGNDKGHHAVPFINFNSLHRIVTKFTTSQPAHTEQDGWISIPRDMLADYRDVKNSELQSYKASFGSHCDIPRSRWQRDLADLTEELAEIDKLIAAAPKPGGWINCSEWMPEEMEDVLVTDGEDVKSMWWNGREWDSFVGKHQYSIGSDEITYWMPLPTPLKQDK